MMRKRNITRTSQGRAVLSAPSKRAPNSFQDETKYDNDKTKKDRHHPTCSIISSSSINKDGLLLLISLFIFLGLPLIAFGWYIMKYQIHVERETGAAIFMTLVIGVIIAVASHFSNDSLLKLVQSFHGNESTDVKSMSLGQKKCSKHDNFPKATDKAEDEIFIEEEEWIQPQVHLLEISTADDYSKRPTIVNEKERQQIAEQVLPRTLADHYWRRMYSLARDGDTFEACMRALEDERRTLIVIKTTKSEVLGGYADVAWKSKGAGIVRKDEGGSGSCVFRFAEEEKIRVFKWTGANRYTQLVDADRRRLAMGAGDFESNCYAWSVERNFMIGTTGRCPTFGNEPLCSQQRYDILDLEVYGFSVG